jgi:hypothetical protein
MTSIGANSGHVVLAQAQTAQGNKTEAEPGGEKEQIPPVPGTAEYQALFPNSGVEEIQDMLSIQPDANRQYWV